MSEVTAAGRPSAAGSYVVPMTQHQPERPTWTCTSDGQPWPCPVARVHLRSRYAGDPTRLAVYMSTLLMTAAADTGHCDVPPPELFNRFMAWIASTPSTPSTMTTSAELSGAPVRRTPSLRPDGE